jgi:hypothetical protein
MLGSGTKKKSLPNKALAIAQPLSIYKYSPKFKSFQIFKIFFYFSLYLIKIKKKRCNKLHLFN